MPVLTMAGDADPLIHPEHMLDLDGYADDAHAELLPGVGHFPATEAPDRVIEAALRLFTHEPSPAR
ncbi:MAG TPA: alpha/beta hydrolase [Pseudonocardiaceae bacterium]|jgi:pimeloyl-ACP methyl ester carboxylesterase